MRTPSLSSAVERSSRLPGLSSMMTSDTEGSFMHSVPPSLQGASSGGGGRGRREFQRSALYAQTDEFDVFRRECQRRTQEHPAVVLCAPVAPHDAGFGMARNAFEDVRNLMHKDMGQQ